MADSIDRVFSKAVTTIKTLSVRSGYGSLPRPPLDTRIKLYGLYKQATEGTIPGGVISILKQASEDPSNVVIEDELALKKSQSWYNNRDLSQTEAKKKYIGVLIDTMKIYASGTVESQELLNELEYLYDQIKDLSSNNEDELDLKSPQLLYNPQFQYPIDNGLANHDHDTDRYPYQLYLRQRNLSSSTAAGFSGVPVNSHNSNSGNFLDMRSIYDKNESIYSFHNNNNPVDDTNWKNGINTVINKMIKDLNFIKKLERQRQIDDQNRVKYTVLRWIVKIVGYNIINLIFLILVLKYNQKKKFLEKLIG